MILAVSVSDLGQLFSFIFIDFVLICVDVVEFDNSFSYLRSKKIWYSITIE